ncbi:integrase core domain-containing protein [Siccirubricoccus deserti]|uniref:Transposase n=1 Tax=Siccirubricoccus deserti TaxID=2013562 RepID=A0A9X0UJ44_9PROT|nr:integrase core domain-containing protein [Siccirubricoccus deserti]MBC4017710.1 transposase [Siccirubricoccus deserti]
MGQVQHGSATTTAAVRRAMQHRQESLRGLARRYGINPKTVANGTPFTEPGGGGWTPEDIRQMPARSEPFLCHAFEFACAELNIEHRLTKPRHPWTNGKVERMNRTIKDATVKRFHYQSRDQLRQHLADFVAAYNFARRLKTLRGLTPCEAICNAWTEELSRFIHDPHHQIPGPNRIKLITHRKHTFA